MTECYDLGDFHRPISTKSPEAQLWFRQVPDFSAVQFLAKEPFKRLADRDRLFDALRKAGLPE
jgi:hypothetical protein